MAQLQNLLVLGDSRFLNEINGKIDWSNILSKPTIPAAANNGTLTIQKNGTNVQTFTANQSTNVTANITVPTKVSELTNDSGYTTNTGTVTQVKVGTTAYNPSSGVISLPAYPSVPVSSVAGKTGAVTLTNSDVGLGNVGNFKAVSTVASQGLTATEQSNARANIGAGTSSLTLGTTSTTALKGDTKYAGASTAGGAATSAAKLTNTSKIGDTNKPVYFTASGVPSAISYTIDKSVPSTAVFTDANVKQTQAYGSTYNNNYYLLLTASTTATSTTETSTTLKALGFSYNPYMLALSVGRESSSTIGYRSIALGSAADASGEGSVSLGSGNSATAMDAFAEGSGTRSSGAASHSEGSQSAASGFASHSEGDCTIANHYAQHVFGSYNIQDPSTAESENKGNYIEIVGNGDNTARSNARTLDWDGNEVLAGKLTVGAAPTNNMDVATKQYVDTYTSTTYLPLTGGTLTDALTIARTSYTAGQPNPGLILKASNQDVTTNPSSNQWNNSELNFQDKNGVRTGYVNVRQDTDGTMSLYLEASTKNGSTTYYNDLVIAVDKSGNRSYMVRDPAAFRSAIDLGAAATLGTSGTYTSTGTEVFTRAGAYDLYHSVISANNRLGAMAYKNWMGANETASNIAGTKGCGFIMGNASRVSMYNVAGNAGSYALTLTSLTSANITDWFTITCNATTGLLTVKNSGTAHYLIIIGCC